jgi:hypothetical protein
MYGSGKNSKGEEIQANNSVVLPVAGERVKGNKFISFDFAKDKDENVVEDRAEFVFKQESGALVKISLFEGEEDWQIDNINRTVKHICTKLTSEEIYKEKIEAKPASSFANFVSKIKSLLKDVDFSDKVYTMKFVYNKKGYVNVPQFPNFIATPDKEDTLTTNPKYDKYELEKPVDNDKKSNSSDEDDEELF